MWRSMSYAAAYFLCLAGAGGLLYSQPQPQPAVPVEFDEGIFDQQQIVNEPAAPMQEEGVQAQGKGPVHEAFASPAVSVPQPGPVVAKQVPQPIEELPPEQKPDGENVEWVSGYWHFDPDLNDFMWISGIWRQVPPAMDWVPGAWNDVNGGFQWSSGFWRSEAVESTSLSIVPTPPEPLNAAEPPAPNAESIYIPGSWVYVETRYVWRPPVWAPHRPGWIWVPARYVYTGAGYVFVEGYWDFPLRDRGLLFAPVYITHATYSQPGWRFRPMIVVHDQALLSCLFVNHRVGYYSFGDYYDNRYVGRGYVPWTNYRVNRFHPDPLYTHYRYVNRGNPNWERNLVGVQAQRFAGTAPRPPVNLNMQINLVAKNRPQANQLALLAPVSRINTKVMPMVKVNQANLAVQQQQIQKQINLSKQRSQQEMKAAKFGAPKAGEVARPLAVATTKFTPTIQTEKIKTLPPAPTGNKGQATFLKNFPKTNPNPNQPNVKPMPPEGKPNVKPMPPEGKPNVKPMPPEGKPNVKPMPPEGKPNVKPNPPEGKPNVKPNPPEGKPNVKPNPPEGKPNVKPNPPVVNPMPKPNPPVVNPMPKPNPPVVNPMPKPNPPVVNPMPKPPVRPMPKPNPPEGKPKKKAEIVPDLPGRFETSPILTVRTELWPREVAILRG